MLFGMAFACGNDNGDTNPPKPSINTSDKILPESSTKSVDLTEDFVKQFLTERENNAVNGGLTSPASKTITFESIKFGQVRQANKKDEYEGIPAGATIYPVRAKYTVVNHYNDSDVENEVHYDYEFYKDSFGEWTTLGLGPVR
jgi:hypothetical protein